MMEELKRFEQLSIQKIAIDKERKKLATKIRDMMIEKNATVTPKLDYGKIYLSSKKSYKYSDELEAKEAFIKELQKIEELEGIAEPSIIQFIKYRKSK